MSSTRHSGQRLRMIGNEGKDLLVHAGRKLAAAEILVQIGEIGQCRDIGRVQRPAPD